MNDEHMSTTEQRGSHQQSVIIFRLALVRNLAGVHIVVGEERIELPRRRVLSLQVDGKYPIVQRILDVRRTHYVFNNNSLGAHVNAECHIFEEHKISDFKRILVEV